MRFCARDDHTVGTMLVLVHSCVSLSRVVRRFFSCHGDSNSFRSFQAFSFSLSFSFSSDTSIFPSSSFSFVGALVRSLLTLRCYSPVYQTISSFAVCDMLMVTSCLIFGLRYCTMDQHKHILYGQVGALFVSQIMLASKQGEMMDESIVTSGSIGVFVSILVGVVGAL